MGKCTLSITANEQFLQPQAERINHPSLGAKVVEIQARRKSIVPSPQQNNARRHTKGKRGKNKTKYP